MEVSMSKSNMSTSRQKNCNNCVQSKRRCDRQTPCVRCIEKKVTCIYGKERSQNSSQVPEISLDQFLDMEGLEFANSASPFPPESSMHVNKPEHTQMCFGVEELHPSTFLDRDFHTDMNRYLDSMAEDGGPWLVQADQGILVERQRTPVDEEIHRTYKKMDKLCERYEPWQLYDPRSSVHYLVHRIKRFANDLATRNAAPFMHRYLYRGYMPQCMISCFSASVLYANRTPATTVVVIRSLQQSVRELLESDAVIATPTEKLAMTQALFMYQVIRLFDGDITLRVQAEKDMTLLETWLGDLCKIRENLGELSEIEDNGVREPPPKEWERWIFAESVRRSILLSYSVITLYGIMKDTYTTDDIGPWAYVHRWTLSRHLWEADSSFTFYRMWKEKPHFVTKNYAFAEFIKHGKGDDVDEFGEIMLNAYMGVDETQEFLSHK